MFATAGPLRLPSSLVCRRSLGDLRRHHHRARSQAGADEQVSDDAGEVTFTTIWPGWYQGRTIHIHFRVRLELSADTAVNFTSQIYFDEATNTTVLATADYQKSGTRSTTNANDNFFDASLRMTTTGSVADGYAGSFTVNLDFGDTTGGSTDTTVDCRVLPATVVRRSRRRLFEVELDRSERMAALVRLVRHDDVLASRRTGWLGKGSSTVRVKIPAGVDAGRARAIVTVADAAGNVKIARRSVQVPR